MSSDITISPLSHPPMLRDQVYERLEELIVTGVLPPGQRLLESELAEQLNVSRNPVREALTLLAHSGWVDLRARHGAVVHQPTSREVEDFFQVRTWLEETSARLAATKATEDDVLAMRKILSEGLRAVERDAEVALAECNSRFHRLVSDVADNRVLDEVLSPMTKRLQWYFAPVARLRGKASWDEHEELVAAIMRHDVERAAKVTRDHCEATASLYGSLNGDAGVAEHA